jgi:hypothetical protein
VPFIAPQISLPQPFALQVPAAAPHPQSVPSAQPLQQRQSWGSGAQLGSDAASSDSDYDDSVPSGEKSARVAAEDSSYSDSSEPSNGEAARQQHPPILQLTLHDIDAAKQRQVLTQFQEHWTPGLRYSSIFSLPEPDWDLVDPSTQPLQTVTEFFEFDAILQRLIKS